MLKALLALSLVSGCGQPTTTADAAADLTTPLDANAPVDASAPEDFSARVDGGGGGDGGGACTLDPECAMGFCRFSWTQCAGNMQWVVVHAGTCAAFGGTCANDQDCGPGESCDIASYTCTKVVDQCFIAPPKCPAGCTWQSPHPCACVCSMCPGDGG
jgi:hypothetical protein